MPDYRVKLELDQVSYHALLRAVKAEADGRERIREMAALWRVPTAAAAAAARGAARAIPAARSPHEVSLRSAIARGVSGSVYTSGRASKHNPKGSVGAVVAWHRSPMGRARRGRTKGNRSVLWRAGWLLNQGRLWKHYAWGKPTGRLIGLPQAKGWFDNTVEPFAPLMVAAVKKGLDDMVDRISRRSRG